MGWARSGNKGEPDCWIPRSFRPGLIGEWIVVARIESYKYAMRAFLITSRAVFGLIVLAHIARAVAEGAHVATDPFFILITLLAAGLSAWAWRLLWTLDRR